MQVYAFGNAAIRRNPGVVYASGAPRRIRSLEENVDKASLVLYNTYTPHLTREVLKMSEYQDPDAGWKNSLEYPVFDDCGDCGYYLPVVPFRSRCYSCDGQYQEFLDSQVQS